MSIRFDKAGSAFRKGRWKSGNGCPKRKHLLYLVDHNKALIKFKIIRHTYSDLVTQIISFPENCSWSLKFRQGVWSFQGALKNISFPPLPSNLLILQQRWTPARLWWQSRGPQPPSLHKDQQLAIHGQKQLRESFHLRNFSNAVEQNPGESLHRKGRGNSFILLHYPIPGGHWPGIPRLIKLSASSQPVLGPETPLFLQLAGVMFVDVIFNIWAAAQPWVSWLGLTGSRV